MNLRTTDEVRQAWAEWCAWRAVPTRGRNRAVAEFDAWLAAHDAEVAATLRAKVAEVEAHLDNAARELDGVVHPDDPHCRICRVQGWLRAALADPEVPRD